MKKIFLLALLLLFGCKEEIFLEGTYSSKLLNTETFYEFNEDIVKVKLIVSGVIVLNETGKYEINEDKSEIRFHFPNLKEETNDSKIEGSFTFEEKENSIMIGMFEFIKKK